ncbi:MAG: phage holin family protein [Solirubrobacteraceae bacterium]
MSDASDGSDVPKGIATAIAEISERATLLVREEIELAKAEMAAKASKLVRGAVVGIAAGIFIVTALFFFLIGCAWLLYYYLPGNDFTYFWGFFAMALILLVLGVLAGLIAARAVKRGSPPMPDMAIEEARLIRDTVSSTASDSPGSAPATTTGTATAPGASAAGAATPGVATAAGTSTPGSAPYGAAAPHAAESQSHPTEPPGTGTGTGTDKQGTA